MSGECEQCSEHALECKCKSKTKLERLKNLGLIGGSLKHPIKDPIEVNKEWISIKDKLPEDGEHVIGYCKTHLEPQYHVEPLLFQIYDEKPIWAYLFAFNEGYGYAEYVTHWMPLPEPPKDE